MLVEDRALMKERASISARIALVVVLAAAIGLTNTRPASAKGSWLLPVKDRYEPGEVATLVAYTAGSIPDRRAFRAYLRAAPQGATGNSALLPTDLPVGQLTVQESGHGGYLSLRVSLSFRIPQHLAPGEYELPYCDDPCTNAVIGDLTQWLINIGIPPRYPITRHWALDETEIANLAPEAQIAGPGFLTTAHQVRSGQFDPPPWMKTPTRQSRTEAPTSDTTTLPAFVSAGDPAPTVGPEGTDTEPLPLLPVLGVAGFAVVATVLVDRRRRRSSRSWSIPPEARGPPVKVGN
jgi:hypothetical protein